MTLRFCRSVLIAVPTLALAAGASAQTVAVDAALLERMNQLIEEQQRRLDQQSTTIERLLERVDQMDQRLAETTDAADEAQERAAVAVGVADEAQETAAEAVETAQQAAEPAGDGKTVIASGNEKLKLTVSGQINRAANMVDDGDETDFYFVDNDVSNTRVRFVGTGDLGDGTTLGSVLEIAFSPNNSYDVSQDEESPDDFIDARKADIFVRNDSYGQVSFGKGSAAADDTAEYDLSLVAGPIMYSGVADVVGGIQFTRDGELTGTAVGDVFFNFDGDRQNRVRYDSPVFLEGLQASVSGGDNGRYEGALTWGGDYGDWTAVDIGSVTTLGAISLQEPNKDDVDYRVAGSFSALHNPTGLSVTVSSGFEERDGLDNPLNLYGKLGWDTSIFDFGPTGFGVDYTYGEDIAREGDESVSVGLAAVQLIEQFGWEVYGQFRYFDLDREGIEDPDEIYAGTVGSRLKF